MGTGKEKVQNVDEKAKVQTASEVTYPQVKNGRYVCSDGLEFSDAYFANKHEKRLMKNQ